MRKLIIIAVLLFASSAGAQTLLAPPPGIISGGAAGGDLSGTYPNPTVTNGSHITNGSIPSTGLASTITAGGPVGSATVAPIITYNAAGQLTAASSATVTPAIGSVTGLGTGVATALGVNVGSAGAPVVNGGVLGTPSSGSAANLTGIPGGNITAGTVANSALTNSSTTVSGQTCTLGSSCTVTVAGVTGAAPLASPTFTGTVTLPDSTTVASTGITSANNAGISVMAKSGQGAVMNFTGQYGASTDVALISLSGQKDGALWSIGVDLSTGTATKVFQIGSIGVGYPLSIAYAATGAMTFGGTNYTNCTALTTSSGVVTCTASDARLKTDRGELDPNEALAFAMRVPVKRYDFTDSKNEFSDERSHIGLMAQEVQKFAPHIAETMVRRMAPTSATPDGTLSLDYAQTGPIALAAVKAVEEQVRDLRVIVALLTAWCLGLTIILVRRR